MLAWMNRGRGHIIVPLVIIDNLNIDRARRAFGPLETYSPLVVDPNTVVPFPMPLQRLKTVPRQDRQVLKSRGGFEPIKFEPDHTLNPSEGRNPLPMGKVLGRRSAKLTITSYSRKEYA